MPAHPAHSQAQHSFMQAEAEAEQAQAQLILEAQEVLVWAVEAKTEMTPLAPLLMESTTQDPAVEAVQTAHQEPKWAAKVAQAS